MKVMLQTVMIVLIVIVIEIFVDFRILMLFRNEKRLFFSIK